MTDPRDPLEISYSLQLLTAGVALEDCLVVAQVLACDRWGQMRSPQEQALIWQVWQQLLLLMEVRVYALSHPPP